MMLKYDFSVYAILTLFNPAYEKSSNRKARFLSKTSTKRWQFISNIADFNIKYRLSKYQLTSSPVKDGIKISDWIGSA